MAKTIRNIVSDLVKEGFDIKVYVRKDGGILIKEINGQKFVGAEGNKIAREIVGETLSERRGAQLVSATKKRTSFAEEFGKEAYTKYRKVAEKWRKANLPSSSGKISMKKFRKIAKEEGLKSALEALSEKEKYASGIAYLKNVEMMYLTIYDYIRNVEKLFDYDTSPLVELAEKLRASPDGIRDEWIEPAYQELYRLNREPLSNALIKEVAENTEEILRL